MCQLCALAVRHQKLSSRGVQSLNHKPLSVLVTLNPHPQKSDPSSTSNLSQSIRDQ